MNKFESHNNEESVESKENLILKQENSESQEVSRQMKFPYSEGAIKLYEKEYGDNPEEIKRVRDIFDAFFNEEISNIKLYESERYGAAFPYTSIDIGSFAKILYEQYAGRKAEITSSREKIDGEKNHEKEPRKIDREFVFPGAPFSRNDAGPFHYVEEAMHQCVQRLPTALKNLQDGKEPDEFEIFTFGLPTNELGSMSPDFFEKLKKEPIVELGNILAEFIEKNGIAKENPDDKLNIELFGISMGAGLAAITGEKLLETGMFTQDDKQFLEDGLPRIKIRAQSFVSGSRSKIKKSQIPLGFAADVIATLMSNSYVHTMKSIEPKFIKQMYAILAERGILENKSEDQKKMKNESMRAMISALGKGLILKPETNINEIYGLKDMTTYTSSLSNEAKKQKESYAGFLGQNLVKPRRENSRVFAVDTMHMPPFFRLNELKRIRRAANELDNLEKNRDER